MYVAFLAAIILLSDGLVLIQHRSIQEPWIELIISAFEVENLGSNTVGHIVAEKDFIVAGLGFLLYDHDAFLETVEHVFVLL